MRKLKVRFCNEKDFCLLNKNTRFYMNNEQFTEYFLSPNFEYEFVNSEEKADICFISIKSNLNLFNKEEVNILLSIENVSFWNIYKHFKNYSDYKNTDIDIFLYNHKSKFVKLENAISIPTVYLRINYFKKVEDYYKNHENLQCQFNKKNFCLKTKRGGFGRDMINKFYDFLKEKNENIDDIEIHDNFVKNKSCYNSIEFLEVLNKYKFIIYFENSIGEGYITEKIFNCFLAKTIPVYFGAPDVENFINKDSFINIKTKEDFENAYEKMQELNDNEEKYNEFINKDKINKDFIDENYIEEFDNIIKKKLNL